VRTFAALVARERATSTGVAGAPPRHLRTPARGHTPRGRWFRGRARCRKSAYATKTKDVEARRVEASVFSRHLVGVESETKEGGERED